MPVDGKRNNAAYLLSGSIVNCCRNVVIASKKSWNSKDFCQDRDQYLFFVLEAVGVQDVSRTTLLPKLTH